MLLEELKQHIHKSSSPFAFVLGNPIKHSLSPLMHNTAARAFNIDLSYHALQLMPSELQFLPALMSRDHFKGANITLPYKKEVIEIMDHIDQSVLKCGAMNTVVKSSSEELIGYNTDIYGFMRPLMPFEDEIENGHAILFGTGGASLAVLAALEEFRFSSVTIVSRSPGAYEPYKTYNFDLTIASYHNWAAYRNSDTVLLVNSTPLGMLRKEKESPIALSDVHLMQDCFCYDLVYNPYQTTFLQDAIENGGRPIFGLEMLIHQGSKAFEFWTDHTFPIAEIRTILRKKLYDK